MRSASNLIPAIRNPGPGRLDANGEAPGWLDLSAIGPLGLALWIEWIVMDPAAPGGIACLLDVYAMRI